MPVIYHGHTLTTKIPFKVRRVNAASFALRQNSPEISDIRDVIKRFGSKRKKIWNV